MKTLAILGSLAVLACGGAPETPPLVEVDAGVQQQQPVQDGKFPLCVTWGMTCNEVAALAGAPDDVGQFSNTDPIYGDTYWHWQLPCGDWFVSFDRCVVTARYGFVGTSQPGGRGCNPAPKDQCP